MKNLDTTIRISKKTKELLDRTGKLIGEFGDTYDDVIVKLIDHYRKNNRVKPNGTSR